MHWHRRAPAAATLTVITAVALAGCGSSTLSTTVPPTASAAPRTAAAATPVSSTAPTAQAPGATPASEPSALASSEASHPPLTTPVPGSSLDPAMSDAGVVGRLVIPNDTRNDLTGTHDIIGREADSSDCSFSLDGTEFTAVAWYDAAPNGMLHQMAVTIPADTVPANDGEMRAAISNGSVYADFVSDTGFGTAYGGATAKGDGSSSTIDAVLSGDTMVFSFTGTTWDKIDFSGQMMCAGMAEGGE